MWHWWHSQGQLGSKEPRGACDEMRRVERIQWGAGRSLECSSDASGAGPADRQARLLGTIEVDFEANFEATLLTSPSF